MRTPLVALLMVLAAGAQQPNSAAASLTLNGANGPPWPVTGIELVPSSVACLQLSGAPLMPLVLGLSNTTAAVGLPAPGGLIDLDPATLIVVPPAAFFPPLATDATGVRVLGLPIPAVGVEFTAGLQAAVGNPGAPAGYTLTAAAGALFSGTAAVIPIAPLGTLGGAPAVLLDLTPFGFTIPFYGASYTRLFINAPGSVTFSAASSDFTPTAPEFVALHQRIAPYWTLLQPELGGTVQATVQPNGPSPFVQVDYTAVPSWAALTVHTFWLRIHSNGDIVMSEVGAAPPPSLEIGVGISPGLSLSPVTTSRNLSASTGYVGIGNEALFELFVPPTNPVLPPNPYDLGGVPLCFSPVPTGGAAPAYRIN